MRGIAGIIHFKPDQPQVPHTQICRMVDRMAIGPFDRKNVWCNDAAGLAHLTQFTVPEDQFEMQPLVGAGGRFVLITDALLTNRDELAETFGWSPSGTTVKADSEFVLAAYEKWGACCVEHLEGRFALAIWHPRERRLFAAIDAFAFRPLYYWHRHGILAFATTLRGLFSLPCVSRELNATVFAEGFAGMARVSSETLYRDVASIPRGSSLEADDNGIRLTKYWNPERPTELRLRSDNEYLEAFRFVLNRAVRSSLRTCGNVGVMLSGGLDSSSVAAIASSCLSRQDKRLQAFHLVPADANRIVGELREHDESRYVKDLQREAPQIDFHFLVRAPQTLMDDGELSQFFEDEQSPSHELPLRIDADWEALLRQQNISTMFNGLGGNQLVSPQMRGSNYLGYLAASGHWLKLAREIRGLHGVYGTPWRVLARETMLGAGWRRAPIWPTPLRMKLLNPELLARTGMEERFHEHRSRFTSRTARDLRGALAHELTDMMVQHAGVSPSVISRQSSVLAIAPLFDRRLNEFCLSLPFDQQFRNGNDRRLLREATRSLLPDSVRLRITRGLAQPFNQQTFACHQTKIINRIEKILEDSSVSGWIDHASATSLKNRLAANAGSRQDQNAAISLLAWGEFLIWRHRHTS